MPGFDSVQILILSSIDWDAAWQRHQIFASQLAAAGHDVFFVENSGFRDPGLRDLGRLWDRINRLSSHPKEGVQEDPPAGLRVIAPRLLPPTNPLFRRGNAAVLIPRLMASLRAAGLGPRPLVMPYLPTATTLEILRRLEPCAVAYDCAANFRAHPQAPADFPQQEAALLAQADLVVCDSDFLYQQKRAEHDHVEQIHQGVPEGYFKAKPPAKDFRRFCYFGTWREDLDPAFLAALCKAGFQVTVLGPLKGSPPLPAGVRHVPAVRREELASRLEAFDAFLLPYRINPFLMGVIPAKIYECLAMSRPVLATPLPCFSSMARLVRISPDPAGWVRIAQALPKTETPALRQERTVLARQHTCAKEFQRFHEALRAAWARGQAHP